MIPMSGSAHVPFAIRTSSNQAAVGLEYARNKGFTGSGIFVFFLYTFIRKLFRIL